MESAAPRRADRADRAAVAEAESQSARERARKHQQAAARARARAAEREREAAEQAARAGVLFQLPPDRYLDREDSWLRFGQRVLELAEDPNAPLLERVRFCAIFASALDEFFGVRIAGRMRRMATGLPVENASGAQAEQLLENALHLAGDLSVRPSRLFAGPVRPARAAAGTQMRA